MPTASEGKRSISGCCLKIALDGYGSYLKTDKGCFIVKDTDGKVRRYPAIEKDLGEITLSDGNVVTTRALIECALWDIDVVVTTCFGEPIAMLKNFEDDSYVKTRIGQYEAIKNGKALYLAKQIVIGKIKGQNILLNKYGLRPDFSFSQRINSLKETDLKRLRARILHLEGLFGQQYFEQVFQLFPEEIRPVSRVTYHVYVALNNVFNLAYTYLKWKCYRAIVRAHLEPYLGFLHSLRPTRPNLVYDFMELYRYLIDDFLIRNYRNLGSKDFYPKKVTVGNKKAKRMFLEEDIASDLVNKLHECFKRKVKVRRIRVGRKQEVETLINEEALLLGKYFRDEKKVWVPRVAVP